MEMCGRWCEGVHRSGILSGASEMGELTNRLMVSECMGYVFLSLYNIDTEGKVLQEFGRISPKKKRSVKYAIAV